MCFKRHNASYPASHSWRCTAAKKTKPQNGLKRFISDQEPLRSTSNFYVHSDESGVSIKASYPYRTSYHCLFSVQALVFGLYLSAAFAGTSTSGIFNKLSKSLEEQFKWKNIVKGLFKACFTHGTWLPDVEDLSRKKVFSFRPKEDELFSLTRSCTWNCGKR